jgi:glycosyltransferase involved in cell wall biosynthesis
MLDLPDDEFIVLQLGRLVPRKGVDNVIRAMAPLLHEHGVRARLLIVGGEAELPSEASTPEIGRLRATAAAAGVSAQVQFVGRRDREALSRFYSAADVFVTTPWYEPFGITPLEAMACGTPVVGAAVGGIKSTVVDGVTGFLVPPRDPNALANKLAVLAHNPTLARALGRGGMRRARSLYTWERVAEQLQRVYLDVVRYSQSTRRPTARKRNLVALPEARS